MHTLFYMLKKLYNYDIKVLEEPQIKSEDQGKGYVFWYNGFYNENLYGSSYVVRPGDISDFVSPAYHENLKPLVTIATIDKTFLCIKVSKVEYPDEIRYSHRLCCGMNFLSGVEGNLLDTLCCISSLIESSKFPQIFKEAYK